MAASQNIARLGIVLGLDSAELVTKITEAQQKFGKFKAQIKRDSEDAAKEIVRLEMATKNYGKTLTELEKIEDQIRLGKYRNQPDVIINNLKAQAAAYDKVAAAAKAAEQAKMGKTGGMTAQQQAALGYQTTDIITSLAGGQNPMMVLLQQGGQLRDQFGGFKPLFQGIASAVTPAMVAFTGLAASIGVLGLAFVKGEEESNKFRNSMILTGNFAGIAIDKFNSMATAISTKYNSAIGDSREIMQALVSSGQFTERTLTSVGSLITKVASLSGESAANVAKNLIPSLDGSASSAKRLNEQYNFLTLAQYKQIEALNQQGKAQEAIKMTSDALLEKLDSQAKKLGYLETLWKNLKNAASGFWDWLKSIGRDDPTKAIKDLEAQMERTMQGVAFRNGKTSEYDALKAKRDRIKAELEADIAKVEADSKSAEKNKERIDAYAGAGGASKAKAIAQRTAEMIAQMEYETKAAGLEKFAQIDLAMTRDIEIAKTEIAKRNYDERFAMASANAEELAARIKQIEAKANREKEDLYKESRRKFEELAKTEQDSIEKERERLVVYKENILASQQDLDIALSRLKTQQDLVALSRQENMKDTDRALAVSRIESLDRQREAVIMQREELKQLQDMNAAVFNNMGSAIDNFVRTGKMSFKDLTRSIIQDLISIAMKAQMVSMFKGLKFFVASGGGSPVDVGTVTGSDMMQAFADGGDPPVGVPSLVGEQGPEIFVPRQAGTILPNKMLGAMSNNQPQVVYNGPYIANMNAIDTQSGVQFLAKNKQTIWAVNQSAQRSLPASR
jgi:phage-related minor tail protein